MSGPSRQWARRAGGSLSALVAACALLALLSPARALAEAYTWRSVQIVGGGFVPGIVFNATEPDLVYARTDIGGAYRGRRTALRTPSSHPGPGPSRPGTR
jgi:xyloglucan-specific exo-beta-1,4-glucanase